MRFNLLLGIFTALGISSGSQAQDTSDTFSFNLFSFEGAYVNRVFNFDADYTAKYGIPIEVPFAVEIPVRQDIELIADGKPSGGIVKFTFAAKSPEGRKFVENLHIVGATFPIPQGGEDPMLARLKSAAKALNQSAFPAAVQGYSDVKMIGTREIAVNGMRAVEILGRYQDPDNGSMVLQLVAIPHPDRAESYFIVHNISQTLVPLSGPEQLPETLGGRVLDSFSYK